MQNPPSLLVRLGIWALFLGVGLGTTEFVAGRYFGFGKPVVYEAHPLYGYRPLPNQNLIRFGGARLTFNNKGLRADHDWDTNPKHKILFLGDSVTYGGSYISNTELFSHIASNTALPSFQNGNAGVNAWGVLNVQALVQTCDFTPAEIYVLTFPEGDFYRGTTRLPGQPFWAKQPKFALEELALYALYQLNLYRYEVPDIHHNPVEAQRVAQDAANKLKGLQDYLKHKGLKVMIYLTPTLGQALGNEPKDTYVIQALNTAGVSYTHLLDKVQKSDPVASWYCDSVHLTKAGHVQWGRWIAEDLKKHLPTP